MTDHIAIMKKSWNLTEKILTREKTIESRWYKNKYPPWDKIKPAETIYFKNSGEPVTIKTKVEKVLQFSDLNKNRVEEARNKLRKFEQQKIKFKKAKELFRRGMNYSKISRKLNVSHTTIKHWIVGKEHLPRHLDIDIGGILNE